MPPLATNVRTQSQASQSTAGLDHSGSSRRLPAGVFDFAVAVVSDFAVATPR